MIGTCPAEDGTTVSEFEAKHATGGGRLGGDFHDPMLVFFKSLAKKIVKIPATKESVLVGDHLDSCIAML